MLDLNKLCGMNGKTAIITGAASGIGAGIARFFANAGVSVVIADINEELARKVEQEIKEAGGKAEFIKCNVTKEADCKALADNVAEKYSKIDILVNCAGVARRHTVETLPESDWDLAINVTLKSVYLMCKHVVPHMKKAGGGKIVNIAFAVPAAFVFGDHLGFTAGYDAAMLGPVIAAKLTGGVLAVLAALLFTRKKPAQNM